MATLTTPLVVRGMGSNLIVTRGMGNGRKSTSVRDVVFTAIEEVRKMLFTAKAKRG